jgi:hypothetical protein
MGYLRPEYAMRKLLRDSAAVIAASNTNITVCPVDDVPRDVVMPFITYLRNNAEPAHYMGGVAASGHWQGNTEFTAYAETTGTHTYIPADLVEGGEFSMTYYFNCTDLTGTLLAANAETVTITWNPSRTWAASCFCIDIGASAKIGETMQQTVKLKVAGAVSEVTSG